MQRRALYRLVLLVAAGMMLMASADARASVCGTAPAGWNAPNGAIVVQRGASPVREMINAAGEYFTHSMLSHGSDSVSQSTMRDPIVTPQYGCRPSSYSICPIQYASLESPRPGAERINMGAVYTMIGGGSEAIEYHDGGSLGATVTNGLAGLINCASSGDGRCYQVASSDTQSGYTWIQYISKWSGYLPPLVYGLNQWINSKSVQDGSESSEYNDGMVCSTFIAWAYKVFTGQASITKYYYPNASVVQPGAWALYNSIINQCNQTSSSPYFWFLSWFGINCNNAANQIMNCVARVDSGQCRRINSIWANTSYPYIYQDAWTISPDHLIGRGHSGGGPWAGTPGYAVQWNSGGSVYGCWH